AGGGGRVVPGQLQQYAQAEEGDSLPEPVAGAAGERQGLPVAGGGGPVVAGQPVHKAQLGEGVSLAGLVTGIAVERQGRGGGGGGGRVGSGVPWQCAQFAERVGLAEPVVGLARRGQGGLVEGGGLVPVAAGGQEAAHRGGYRDGMPGAPAGGGVVRGSVQVRPLGFQPGGRPAEGGQVRGVRRRVARRWPMAGAGPVGEVPAGGQGGVQVVIQQPPGRGVAVCLVVSGGEGAGVLAEQVVQPVAAGRGLG